MDDYLSDEGLRLKDALREKRDSQNISNQEIADISGLSVHTVANYFSTRSKASSAYTVGKICMALRMSFDRAFGIVPDDEPEQQSKNLARISELEQKCRDYEKDIAHQNEIISMKDSAIENYQSELRKHRPIIFALLAITGMLIVLCAAYFVHFDLSNPNYGLYTG